MKKPVEKIIVALDYANAKDAIAMAKTIANTGVKFKVGMELFYAEGRSILEKLSSYGEIFLDLKLHDIPETMAKSAAVLTEMGVWMFNVHASAGQKAVQTVHERVSEVAATQNLKKPLLIAVTVLTSLSDLTHLGSS